MLLQFGRGIIFVIIGPLITFLLVYSLQIPENEISLSLIKKTTLLLCSLTIFTSLIGHIFIRAFVKSLIITITISEIIYLFVFSFYALNDPVNWQENLMWLPIMIISVAAITLPMAASISYGIGSIVKALKKRKELRKGGQKGPKNTNTTTETG